MIRIKDFPSLKHANAANALYQRAHKEWDHGRMRSAFQLFHAAAKAGMSPAFEIVAQFYEEGLGVKPNKDLALHWYRRASRLGYDSSANNIGCIWRDRNQPKRAIFWLQKAVSLGDDEANLNIAKIYLDSKHNSRSAYPYLIRTSKSRYVSEQTREEAKLLLKEMCDKLKPGDRRNVS